MGDQLPDKNVVAKILRSLTPRFSHVVHSIIEAKDLNTLTVEALGSSLKSHESILHLASEEEEKALHAKKTLLLVNTATEEVVVAGVVSSEGEALDEAEFMSMVMA